MPTHCSLHGPHEQRFPKCSNNNQAARVQVQYILWNIVTLNWEPAPPPLTSPSCYQFNPFNSLRAYPNTSTDGHRRFARGYIAICTAATINLLESITVLETDSTIQRRQFAARVHIETRMPALITRDLRDASLCFETTNRIFVAHRC